MSKYSILLVEDDANLAYLVGQHLEENNYEATICGTGKEGLDNFREKKIHLCILDIVLPDTDGISIAKEIRKKDPRMPIVFLTSRNLKSDKMQGYEVGADDYITKPFDADLLTMKIGAIIKRCYAEDAGMGNEISVGSVVLDTNQRRLKTKSEEVKLSGTECGILASIMKHAGKAVDRDDIMKDVWGRADFFISKSLDVYMTKIRKIIREHTDLNLETVHGVGYIIND